jgi:hypothetical protein
VKFETWITIRVSVAVRESLTQVRPLDAAVDATVQKVRDHGIELLTPEARRPSNARRLSETAVTRSDWSIENATISEYDGSFPTERDVGPVQRRHHTWHVRLTAGGEHLPSEEMPQSRAERRSARG